MRGRFGQAVVSHENVMLCAVQFQHVFVGLPSRGHLQRGCEFKTPLGDRAFCFFASFLHACLGHILLFEQRPLVNAVSTTRSSPTSPLSSEAHDSYCSGVEGLLGSSQLFLLAGETKSTTRRTSEAAILSPRGQQHRPTAHATTQHQTNITNPTEDGKPKRRGDNCF